MAEAGHCLIFIAVKMRKNKLVKIIDIFSSNNEILHYKTKFTYIHMNRGKNIIQEEKTIDKSSCMVCNHSNKKENNIDVI